MKSEPTDLASPLDDDSVIDYLKREPEFFQRNARLLAELNLPHDSGSAVSLVERQVAILRERNMTMRRRMNELVDAAKANDDLFAKTRTLTLELLNVDSWPELNEVLATYVLTDFQADFVCCHLTLAPVYLDHLRSCDGELPSRHLTSSLHPQCLTLRAAETRELFPVQGEAIESSAVIAPLLLEQGEGCLVIGSRDSSRFSADMDTLFVRYIAEVLSRVVQRLSS